MPATDIRARIIVEVKEQASKQFAGIADSARKMGTDIEGANRRAGKSSDDLAASTRNLIDKMRGVQQAFFNGELSAKEAAHALDQIGREATSLASKTGIASTAEIKLGAELRNVGTQARDTARSLDAAGASAKRQQEIVNGAKVAWTTLAAQFYLVQQAARYVMQALDATVGSTVEYAKQVRDLSRAIGASAEDASKLIQAADDVQVSYDTLRVGLIAAIRKGIVPSIDGLARLSDQYLAIQDPIARTKFLVDRFGRSGAELAPLMERGAAGIRELGDAAEETGLVLSGQALRDARAYEVVIDDLKDSFRGFITEISIGFLPALTRQLEMFNRLTVIDTKLFAGVREGNITLREAIKLWIESRNNLIDIAENERDLERALAGGTEALGMNQRAVALSVQANAMLADSNRVLGRSEEEIAAAMGDLHVAMQGTLGKDMLQFRESQENLALKISETNEKIHELSGLPYLTTEQKTQLGELRTRLGELGGQYSQNADEHTRATRQILFNMVEQRLAIDGLADDEGRFLEDLALKWGLVDLATHDAMRTIRDELDKTASDRNWDIALQRISAIEYAISRIPREIRTRFFVDSNFDGTIPAGIGEPFPGLLESIRSAQSTRAFVPSLSGYGSSQTGNSGQATSDAARAAALAAQAAALAMDRQTRELPMAIGRAVRDGMQRSQ